MKNKFPLPSCFLTISFLLLFSCTKENKELSFPTTPEITLIETSQNTLVEFQDRLVLTFEYTDGDGDLGTSNPDINSIFIQDNRLDSPDEYYLPPLAPEEATISIQGQFQVELSPTFLLGNGTEESIVFSIFVKDRAGNQSNTVETQEIIVTR